MGWETARFLLPFLAFAAVVLVIMAAWAVLT